MNMKTNTHRRGLHRIVAFLLCAVCVFSLLPAQAFAAGVGQKASSWLGDQYVGSDGQHYYSPVPTNFLAQLPKLCDEKGNIDPEKLD